VAARKTAKDATGTGASHTIKDESIGTLSCVSNGESINGAYAQRDGK
jgi:hypothetical protein